VEDGLPGLARELLPNSLAPKRDEDWAHELCKGALSCLVEHHSRLPGAEKEILDLSCQHSWNERMHDAGLANAARPPFERRSKAGSGRY